MNVDQDTRKSIQLESRIVCHHHGSDGPEIAGMVTEFLESDRIVNLRRQGPQTFQPAGSMTRNVYAATRDDGAEIKFAFTHMQTIMFLGKRSRTNHLYPEDAREKLGNFLKGR